MTSEYHDATELLSPLPSIGGTGDDVGRDEGAKPHFKGGTLATLEDWTYLHLDELPSLGTRRNGHHESQLEQRFRRAMASALMDSACLYILHTFRQKEYIDINDLSNLIAGPAGWIKSEFSIR